MREEAAIPIAALGVFIAWLGGFSLGNEVTLLGATLSVVGSVLVVTAATSAIMEGE